jgi:hypothetical protein
MATTIDTNAFDRAADPVFRVLTPQQVQAIVAYRADDVLQRRIGESAEKSTEGELSADERAEYEGYVLANRFVALLQARARTLLE